MQSADNPGMLTSEQIALMNLAQEANNNKETNNGRGYLDPNTSQAPQHHTLGQMAERFQERARTESQQKPADGASNSGDDDGADDYDDDDDEEDDEEGGKAVARGNESTGRWTRAEHDLFVKALKLYGKEWKKVASMVKTRTVVQTRTHAQKYFQKLSKSGLSEAMSFMHDGDDSKPFDPDQLPAARAKAKSDKTPGQMTGQKRGRKGGSGNSAHYDISPSNRPLREPGMFDQFQQLSPSRLLSSMRTMPSGINNTDTYPHVPEYNFSFLPSRPGALNPQTPLAFDANGMIHAYLSSSGDPSTLPAVPQQTEFQLPGAYGTGTSIHQYQNTPRVFHARPSFDFSKIVPQPSPAAGGKRKQLELKAAEMLALSSASVDEGIELLAKLKKEPSNESQFPRMPAANRKNKPLSLSIVNPYEPSLNVNESNFFDDVVNSSGPGTPWDRSMKELEDGSFSLPATQVLRSRSISSSNVYAVPVSTPSEQKNFLSKVKSFIAVGDIAGLTAILNAAEYSAASYVAAGGSDVGQPGEPLVHTVSVSNLMNVFTSPPQQHEDPSTAANTLHNAASAFANRTPHNNSLVARSLNGTGDNATSVLMAAVHASPSSAIDGTPQGDQNLILAVCSLLTEHGASVFLLDAAGNSCLHHAAQRGYDRVGRLFVSRGCPINLLNTQGDAALHIAARHGHASFLEMLADLGANFHLRNGKAYSALDLAGVSLPSATATTTSSTNSKNNISSCNANDSQPMTREDLRQLMYLIQPRLRTLILHHEDCLAHSTRRPSDWEGPDRILKILQHLQDQREFRDYELEISNQFDKAGVELLGRAHSAEYITLVNNLSKQFTTTDKHNSAPQAFTPLVQKLTRPDSEEFKKGEFSDTTFSAGTLKAARRAAGAVAHAVDCVLLGRNRNAFCVVRPPGHHAGFRGLLDDGTSCGFCIFNNVAAAALYALEERKCERVAIIDLDIHHGNGTEDIVRRYRHPSRLFFFSLHIHEKNVAPGVEFFPGTGAADDNVHNIINVALTPMWHAPSSSPPPTRESSTSNSSPDRAGTSQTVSHDSKEASSKLSVKSDSEVGSWTNPLIGKLSGREGYRQAILTRLIPSLRAFNPSLVLLSTGFDAADGDVGNIRNYPGFPPERGMDLRPEDFAWTTTEVARIADICCSGRLVSVLEGGYGEYDALKLNRQSAARSGISNRKYSTRHSSNDSRSQTQADGAPENVLDHPADSVQDDKMDNKIESAMNRDTLALAAAAHVRSLIDPYGACTTVA